jgi:hypothetical protein
MSVLRSAEMEKIISLLGPVDVTMETIKTSMVAAAHATWRLDGLARTQMELYQYALMLVEYPLTIVSIHARMEILCQQMDALQLAQLREDTNVQGVRSIDQTFARRSAMTIRTSIILIVT